MSGATVEANSIPFPALTLPFCNGEWSTVNYKENITIDVITPRLCAGIVRLGEEARAGDEHRILSSLSLELSRNFALTYCTNMTTTRCRGGIGGVCFGRRGGGGGGVLGVGDGEVRLYG